MTRVLRGVRGLGGDACLTRDSLQVRVSMVSLDEFSHFMWVWIHGLSPLPRDIYIAVCYFPPALSHFAIHSDPVGDPYLDLYVGIIQYSLAGEVILGGLQCLYQRSLDSSP